MSGILGCFGKSNCSALPKFIWIITTLSFEFSLLAFARSVLVRFILPAVSLFCPFSSYWISMVVETLLLGESSRQRIATRQSIILKLCQAGCTCTSLRYASKNVLFSWVCAPYIFAIYNTALPGCLLSVFSTSSTWIKYLILPRPPPKKIPKNKLILAWK